MRQTNAAGLALRGKFHRADDQYLAHRAAPALHAARRIVFRAERKLRLVDLDQRLQRAAAGFNHRPALLVEEEPGGLVAAQPALRLKLQRRHALKWLARRCAARNQVFSGRWLDCEIFPAVTEVCRRQPAHSQVGRSRFSSQPLRQPQAGQTKLSGHRRLKRYRAAGRIIEEARLEFLTRLGRSYFRRAGIMEHQGNTTPAVRPSLTTSEATGTKGISL